MPELLKILEAAIRHDPRQAIDYATLLADKLEKEGATRQASSIRALLSRSAAQAVRRSGVEPTPRDEAHNLPMLDLIVADEGVERLSLSSAVGRRVHEFVALVEAADALALAGVESPGRMLLHGPPGTGKTSIARLVAHRLGLPLYLARSDALVSSLLGQTSRNIRAVFDFASRTPCVLLLDEFDALAKRRADTQEVGELQRVVIALLENMDALSPSTIVIAATNHPQLLDTAVWRRFDFILETHNPGPSDRKRIWQAELQYLSPGERDLVALVDQSEGLSGAGVVAAARDIVQQSVLGGKDSFDPPLAFRRLARFLWYQEGGSVSDDPAEIRALRKWMPEVFTIRALGALYGVSTRQITNMLEGAGGDREPADLAAVPRS